MSTQPPAGAPAPGAAALHPVVSVTIGQHQVLRSEGDHTHVHVVPFADHALVVAALAKALAAFTAKQPAPSPLLEALDAVEKLSALADPAMAKDGLAAISEAITDFGHRIKATAAARTLN